MFAHPCACASIAFYYKSYFWSYSAINQQASQPTSSMSDNVMHLPTSVVLLRKKKVQKKSTTKQILQQKSWIESDWELRLALVQISLKEIHSALASNQTTSIICKTKQTTKKPVSWGSVKIEIVEKEIVKRNGQRNKRV